MIMCFHRLMTPINVMRMKSPTEVACRHGVAAEKISFARSRKIWARSLLTLSVLVQNRRKDKKRILTFAAQAQIVSYNNTVEDVMRGRGEGDNMFTFQSDIGYEFHNCKTLAGAGTEVSIPTERRSQRCATAVTMCDIP